MALFCRLGLFPCSYGNAYATCFAPATLRRELQHVSTGRKKEGMLFFGIESAAALIVSLFINVCVVSVFAKGFYGKGIENIGLENAGNFLGETFGTSMVRHTFMSCAFAESQVAFASVCCMFAMLSSPSRTVSCIPATGR